MYYGADYRDVVLAEQARLVARYQREMEVRRAIHPTRQDRGRVAGFTGLVVDAFRAVRTRRWLPTSGVRF